MKKKSSLSVSQEDCF